MQNQPFILESVFNAPLSKVWTALTDKDEMKQWYFDLPTFEPQVGFRFQFTGGHEDGIQYLHLCEVTQAIHERELTYSWRYEGYAGASLVTFELFEQGNQTLLRLTHAGLETFPKENPDFAAKNFAEGWNHIINQSLQKYLE